MPCKCMRDEDVSNGNKYCARSETYLAKANLVIKCGWYDGKGLRPARGGARPRPDPEEVMGRNKGCVTQSDVVVETVETEFSGNV